ncbi:MAG: GNAT family N-acetyltransferase, partial [Pikeienuella sp.]
RPAARGPAADHPRMSAPRIVPDAARLARLARAHRAAFPPEERGWSAAEIGALAANGRLIAREDDEGFALISLAADEAELLTLAVAPALRRQGAGRALLAAAMAQAAAGGATTMFLEVAEDNEAAIALYRSAGFAPAGRRPRYYRRGAALVDALLLRVSIPAG